jgi:hypothetical protein
VRGPGGHAITHEALAQLVDWLRGLTSPAPDGL